MHDKAVFSAVKWEGLAEEQIASVIKSSMFLKEKYLASGVFDKPKARLVAGGNMQDRSVYALEETVVAHGVVVITLLGRSPSGEREAHRLDEGRRKRLLQRKDGEGCVYDPAADSC